MVGANWAGINNLQGSKPSWKVGLKQFRAYLKEKYRDYLDILL